MKCDLPDGVYGVDTPYFCAAFDVLDGEVIRCAPILRKRFAYWCTRAEWVCPIPEHRRGSARLFRD